MVDEDLELGDIPDDYLGSNFMEEIACVVRYYIVYMFCR